VTRTRYRVVAFAVALAAVTYFDRVCISTLAPSIMRELGLTRLQMSFVFSAFTVAYAAFEIPTAWWGERVGTRRVLARIVVWWSTFTLATAAAWNYASLVVIRFLFGAGEAGAWPSATLVFARWIPASERGRVQGIFFMGAHLAGGVTPALVGLLEPLLGWRGVFAAFAMLGFLWAAAWARWYRDDPAQHAGVDAAELRLIEGGRLNHAGHGAAGGWLRLFAHRNVAALCVAYFANTYGFYFVITWLPSYLEEQRHFAGASLSLFAGLPLLLSVVADVSGGVATDWASRRFGLRIGRAALGSGAYVVAAVAICAAAFAQHASAAGVLIAVAAAASMFTLAPSWATCIDSGREHAGVMSATMNTSGQIGGIISPILLAFLVERFADWRLPLLVMCGLYSAAAIAWLFVDPRRPLGRGTAAT
jgi:MFS family permease